MSIYSIFAKVFKPFASNIDLEVIYFLNNIIRKLIIIK